MRIRKTQKEIADLIVVTAKDKNAAKIVRLLTNSDSAFIALAKLTHNTFNAEIVQKARAKQLYALKECNKEKDKIKKGIKKFKKLDIRTKKITIKAIIIAIKEFLQEAAKCGLLAMTKKEIDDFCVRMTKRLMQSSLVLVTSNNLELMKIKPRK
jgi:hypothetical protein